jgi:WS/DGAT/MGAT family acyltransferase
MSAADVAVLLQERRTAPQHVGGLAVFDPPPAGLDYVRLLRLIEERISLAPRYRQKVRAVPGQLANPVWVDDAAFDIAYHVRRCALPRPGGDQQLLDFCARIQARLLDRSRPLWEMYLVEGLDHGRIAIVTKTHAALVGERDGIDLIQVILDPHRVARRSPEPIWMPEPEPAALALVGDALRDAVLRPTALTHAVRVAARDLRAGTARVTATGGAALRVAQTLLHRPPASPLRAAPGEQRRLAIARTRLADYRRVAETDGATVNDVVLAVLAGALRGWLLSRAVPLRPATSVRALLPVSVVDPPGAGARTRLGPGAAQAAGWYRHPVPGSVRPLLVDLPVGEPDPLIRLARLRYAMATHKASGQAIGADRLADLAGFAPPTLHARGVRAANQLAHRLFSLVITNVPGPQAPRYAGGARMSEMFPFLPLGPGQAMTVALTSYAGGIYYGVNGDWDAVRDVALMSELIKESLAELLTTVGGHPLTAAGATGAGPGTKAPGTKAPDTKAPDTKARRTPHRRPVPQRRLTPHAPECT